MKGSGNTLADRIITRVKNHKVAAVLIVAGLILGAAATLTKSLSEAGTLISMLFRSEPQPKWVAELIRHPIRPGVGLAGVSIGQTEKEVIAVLGEPTTNIG